jgi:lipopolysaccharide/colanic/teichoic acid biosynthesis glycosyltransferase
VHTTAHRQLCRLDSELSGSSLVDRILKRISDLAISIVALVVSLPLMAVIAFAVKLSSAGEVIYRGQRIGRYGKPFQLYKFRTMVTGADRLGPLVTSSCDPRITRVGHLLRRTKLDELPSLWNVIKGDMSLVGPRPENPRSVMLYDEKQRAVLALRPGITSLATVKYRNEEQLLAGSQDLDAAYYHIMLDKLAMELDYLNQHNLWLDMKILSLTIAALFRRS